MRNYLKYAFLILLAFLFACSSPKRMQRKQNKWCPLCPKEVVVKDSIITNTVTRDSIIEFWVPSDTIIITHPVPTIVETEKIKYIRKKDTTIVICKKAKYEKIIKKQRQLIERLSKNNVKKPIRIIEKRIPFYGYVIFILAIIVTWVLRGLFNRIFGK